MASPPKGKHAGTARALRTRRAARTVDLIELVDHGAAEKPACSPRADGEALDVLRVRPHEVAERALVRHLRHPLDGSDLVERPNVRREAAVHAQHLPVYQRLHVRTGAGLLNPNTLHSVT